LAGHLSILHVVRSPIGGIFRHITDLATAQHAAGHSVGLICDKLTGGDFEEERIAAIAPILFFGVARVAMPRAIGPGDARALLGVLRHVGRIRPDVVHAHGAKGGLFGRLAAAEARRRHPVAAFYAPHGGSLHYDPASVSGRLYFGVERTLERLTDGLIHVSAYEADTYRRKIGAPRCPAHVVLNGLRPEEFEPVATVPDAADFLYIGMLRDLKGVDVFLQALSLLKRRGRSFRSLVVGAGEPSDERRYREMATGLAREVTFHPPMPARQAFALARTVVVPSRAESMPYLVLEAAAAGVPIISTDVGGIPEVMAGEQERLVRPGDPAALAEAMALAIAAPERMSAEAALRRDHVKRNFSLANMTSRVEDIYRGALEAYRQRRPSPAATADLSG
jgi:glycosyltransferase involved in cell wall biosynthesis